MASGPLDLITTSAAIAYSTRQLRSAYSGAALRVRRDSDNSEQDIGFLGTGELDTTSLTTFVGANNGYISKWYDQSGNARDLVQATTANQPRIVSAGTVDTTVNGKASIQFIAANSTLLTNSITLSTLLPTPTAWTAFATHQVLTFPTAFDAAEGQQLANWLIDQGGGYWFPLWYGMPQSDFPLGPNQLGCGNYSGTYTTSVSTSAQTGVNYVQLGYHDATTIYHSQNGKPAVTKPDTIGPFSLTGTLRCGGDFHNTTLLFADGWITELLLFGSTLSASDINALGQSLGTRAGVIFGGFQVVPASASLALTRSTPGVVNKPRLNLVPLTGGLTLVGPAPRASTFTGPGDIVSGALAYWGIRAYSRATAGNKCIRLLRSTDSAQLDFNTLISTGMLDVQSILTWLGTANAFVTVLYDQTGNGKDLLQPTLNIMPLLTNLGGGHGADIYSDGLRSMYCPAFSSQAQPISAMLMSAHGAGTPAGVLFAQDPIL